MLCPTRVLLKCHHLVTPIAVLPLAKQIPDHALPSISWTCKKYFHLTKVKRHERKEFQPASDLYTNPIDRLQSHVQTPLLPESEYVFRPTKDEIVQATKIFEPLNIKGRQFEFLGSYPNPHVMPDWDLPEVAFIGKSNVGKSSLLAAMFAQVPDVAVRCSSKPGHTKLMNVFRVGRYFNLVDMPGYGFNMPDHFETSVEAYIKSRRNLMRVFMLIDGEEGPGSDEIDCVEMMEESTTPYVVVMTKIDKAHPSKLLRNLMKVMNFKEDSGASSCFPQPFLVSSINGEGLGYLQAFVAYITGNLKIKGLS